MYACTPSAWPGVLRVQKVELEMVLSCLPCAPYVNSGPLKEQCVLLTAEPCLQSLTKHFVSFICFVWLGVVHVEVRRELQGIIYFPPYSFWGLAPEC